MAKVKLTERQKFKKWAQRKNIPLQLIVGRYSYAATEYAWQAWQARAREKGDSRAKG